MSEETKRTDENAAGREGEPSSSCNALFSAISFCVLNGWKSSVSRFKLKITIRTAVDSVWQSLDWVQDRLAAFLVAVCAYQMRWLVICHRFLQRVSDTPSPRFYHFIPLLLCFPCFFAGQFVFKIMYALNHRRLLYQGRVQARLGFPKLLQQLKGSRFNLAGCSQIEERFAEIKRRLEAIGSNDEACAVHGSVSRVADNVNNYPRVGSAIKRLSPVLSGVYHDIITEERLGQATP